MKTKQAALLLVTFLLGSTLLLTAGKRPNFSGTWVLDPEKSDMGQAGRGQGWRGQRGREGQAGRGQGRRGPQGREGQAGRGQGRRGQWTGRRGARGMWGLMNKIVIQHQGSKLVHSVDSISGTTGTRGGTGAPHGISGRRGSRPGNRVRGRNSWKDIVVTAKCTAHDVTSNATEAACWQSVGKKGRQTGIMGGTGINGKQGRQAGIVGGAGVNGMAGCAKGTHLMTGIKGGSKFTTFDDLVTVRVVKSARGPLQVCEIRSLSDNQKVMVIHRISDDFSDYGRRKRIQRTQQLVYNRGRGK